MTPTHISMQEEAVRARQVNLSDGGSVGSLRSVPIEAPVAVEFNGIGYAVMMATPHHLEAYALGLTVTEGLVEHPTDVRDIQVVPVDGGWVIRITLPETRMERVVERARTRASESSCGLCGIETIEEVLRPLPRLSGRIAASCQALARALNTLRDHQPLGRATGAVHAAAFCDPDGCILAAMEDVGRHNALDKLVGTLLLRGLDPMSGFILLSARCSYELVEKTVRAGCPMLVTISAPTSLSVHRARSAGLALITLARPDSVLVMNDPWGSFE